MPPEWLCFPTVCRFLLRSHFGANLDVAHAFNTMSSELNLKPVKNEASGSRPHPTISVLRPWEFEYTPSKDGKDLNLLIMFHGLGKSSNVTMNEG